jgi:hypothetical protein
LAVAGGAILVAATQRWGTWVATTAAVALIWPAYQIAVTAHDLSKEDTRNVACRWVESNIQAGTKLLCEENGPPLKLSAEALQQFEAKPGQENVNQAFTRHFDRYLHYQRLAAKEVVSYNVFEIRPVWWRNDLQIDDVVRLSSDYDADMGNPRRPVGVKPYSDYVVNGYQYAIVQRGSAEGFVVKQEPQQRDAYQRFYAELFAHGVVVQEFAPNGQLRGPVVRVYRLSAGDSSNKTLTGLSTRS